MTMANNIAIKVPQTTTNTQVISLIGTTGHTSIQDIDNTGLRPVLMSETPHI
jgi:hypothetical protein